MKARGQALAITGRHGMWTLADRDADFSAFLDAESQLAAAVTAARQRRGNRDAARYVPRHAVTL